MRGLSPGIGGAKPVGDGAGEQVLGKGRGRLGAENLLPEGSELAHADGCDASDPLFDALNRRHRLPFIFDGPGEVINRKPYQSV
jgi:hypothetical protein